MPWNKTRIDSIAVASAQADHVLFEALGLEQLEAAHVLDAGCFDGFNTRLKFAPYENIAHVVGVDLDESAIADARAQTDDARFEWHCSPFENCIEPDASFDLVYFSHSLQHVKDKDAALRRGFDLLKPGGFLAVKTIDDSLNISSPDPERLMERVYGLYEGKVLPYTQHTRHTDRRFGRKCPGLLIKAGFGNISTRIMLNENSGLGKHDRTSLFERGTYFRTNVPAEAGDETASEMKELLAAWQELCERPDYYFASATVLVLAQKPRDDGRWTPYRGPLFGAPPSAFPDPNPAIVQNGYAIEPMAERDLGEVMTIEMKSFPDPWVPLAYALELRHNPNAHYMVIRNAERKLRGYLGWWENDGFATIAHVAVDPDARRSGFGKVLLEKACEEARRSACHTMQLQVRGGNATARSFYRACGFTDVSVSKGYYTNPDDDAVIMVRSLEERQLADSTHGGDAADEDTKQTKAS